MGKREGAKNTIYVKNTKESHAKNVSDSEVIGKNYILNIADLCNGGSMRSEVGYV